MIDNAQLEEVWFRYFNDTLLAKGFYSQEKHELMLDAIAKRNEDPLDFDKELADFDLDIC